MAKVGDTFEKYFEKGIGCWIWKGGKVRSGKLAYPAYRQTRGHRESYLRYVGKIPKGYQIDHLCRNTLCVRPDHLEAVTHSENVRRSNCVSSICRRKTVCLRGHKFDRIVFKLPGRYPSRSCSVCEKIRHKRALKVRREDHYEKEHIYRRMRKLMLTRTSGFQIKAPFRTEEKT